MYEKYPTTTTPLPLQIKCKKISTPKNTQKTSQLFTISHVRYEFIKTGMVDFQTKFEPKWTVFGNFIGLSVLKNPEFLSKKWLTFEISDGALTN